MPSPVRVSAASAWRSAPASSRWRSWRSSSLAAFGGRVEALIPLYAVGVFTSITLSQLGMVVHWRRTKEPGWRRSLAINGIGAMATAIVTLIFAAAKFALGAWLVVVVVPLLVLGMRAMDRLYAGRRAAIRVEPGAVVGPPRAPPARVRSR